MKPVLHALLIADHVYIDKATNKRIVVGIFNTVWFENKPVEIAPSPDDPNRSVQKVTGGQHAGSPYAYINVTDVYGDQKFELQYVCIETGEVLFKGGFEIGGASPLDIIELGLGLPPIPTKAGVYALELVWKDDVLGSARIKVQEGKPKVKDDDSH